MNNVQRVTQLFLLRGASLWVRHQQLNNGWRVYDSAVALSESTCPSRDGLLSHAKLIIQISAKC